MSTQKDRNAMNVLIGIVIGYFLGTLVFYCFYTLL